MKKLAIVALIATLTSCGGSEEKAPAKNDSTAVKSDSTKVEAPAKETTDTIK